MSRLANKAAMVTGGGNGLGAAICRRLAEEGASVAVTDIDEEAAKSVATSILENGGRAISYPLDVTKEIEWERATAAVCEIFGKLDILVNNAGIALLASIEDTSLDQWRRIQSVNLDGTFLGTKSGILAMKKNGSGSIINISSIRGIVADPMSTAYDASKGGVRMLTKSAALHCATQRYGIRVNSVHPGYVLTDLVKNAIKHLPDADSLIAQVTELHPIGRLGTAEDVANAVLYLASDEASFVTGTELVVDGGFTAQ